MENHAPRKQKTTMPYPKYLPSSLPFTPSPTPIHKVWSRISLPSPCIVHASDIPVCQDVTQELDTQSNWSSESLVDSLKSMAERYHLWSSKFSTTRDKHVTCVNVTDEGEEGKDVNGEPDEYEKEDTPCQMEPPLDDSNDNPNDWGADAQKRSKRFSFAPTVDEAKAAHADLKNILKPPRKLDKQCSRNGYTCNHLPPALEKDLTLIKDFLWEYMEMERFERPGDFSQIWPTGQFSAPTWSFLLDKSLRKRCSTS
ncbi:hypothetical protein DL96DRAFT_8750 [Flagelloscypha sp. PMI_526]|nr:hypothetical protein DL96DRAFT_8750 [Flagelloscypha sp. PMI_526]